MRFYFITDSPELAVYVSDRGVDRIFVDLEVLGKEARQGHLSTVISRHSFDGLAAVCRAAPRAEVMARLNPVNPATATEVEQAIGAGAKVLMLPMFRTVGEVRQFAELTAGRARICLLAETADAAGCLFECATVDGVDEVHIGLNDLSLDLGLPFMFQPLASGLIDEMAAKLRHAGKAFGIGGIARVGEGLLPAEKILFEHVRLGSTAAILSRTFHRQAASVARIAAEMDFAQEIARLQAVYAAGLQASDDQLASNRAELVSLIETVVDDAAFKESAR